MRRDSPRPDSSQGDSSGGIDRGRRWADLTVEQPTLAALCEEMLLSPGVLLIGTTRRDGSARISGVEPLGMDGDLWLSMMSSSAKCLDLRRDPRISVNSIIGGPEPATEIKLRGIAHLVVDRSTHERYAAQVATELRWHPIVGQFTLFRIEIVDVTVIGYDPETQGQHVARWPEGIEYVRPATSPTSLGPRRAVRRVLQ